MHRLFLAIPVPQEIQQRAFEFQRRHTTFNVRWIPGGNLHVTLIPPWNEYHPQSVVALLRSSRIPIRPFRISYASISVGPDRQSPRLIWATGESPNELLNLKSLSGHILNKQAKRPDFKTHITLARFRPESFKTLPLQTLNESIRWNMDVDSFALYESHLSPAGATYTIRETFTFT